MRKNWKILWRAAITALFVFGVSFFATLGFIWIISHWAFMLWPLVIGSLLFATACYAWAYSEEFSYA